MTSREKLAWMFILGLVAVAGVMLCVFAALAYIPRAEAAPPAQSSQTRTVDWYYWLDTGYPRIQRARLDGSGVAETVVSNTEMSTTHDFAVDGGYVYWGDDGNNEIRRKADDGTGSVETLASVGISSPYHIAVYGSYVYWADTGNDTIKEVATTGGTVTTIADSSDGVSNVTAIDLGPFGNFLYWADSGNDSVREVQTFSSHTVTTLVSAGLGQPWDLAAGRNGSYVYVLDRNGSASTVKRVETFGSHVVSTLAENTAQTPMDDPVALTLDPDNDFVYWLDEDDAALRRVAVDGATGTFETLTTSAGGAVTDLAVSPDGGSAYWLDNSGNVAKHLFTDGSGTVRNVIASGLSVPARLGVSREMETITGACITDAGTLTADYASFDWEADIDAACPSAFYTFRLADAADLRITATSSSINPLPILRTGGLGGELAALTEVSNGAATPYVYMAGAGQHTIELVRETNSSNTTGGFSATLQTQPTLSGCDVNLGTLSSDQIQVFGAYDPDCGDTRKYFFYLEFQASVSASVSAEGFTPRIELRPGAASDSSTPTAEDSGNPADFYQSVASGSYRVNVENITEGDTYNLSLQAFGLPPPTRTPIPTPTPRLQIGVDIRLEPDPRSYAYELNHPPYTMAIEGNPDSFPALVRSDDEDVRFTGVSVAALDCSSSTDNELEGLGNLAFFHVHICGDSGRSATIEVTRQSDRALLATYTIHIRSGTPVPTPAAVPGPPTRTRSADDPAGLSIIVAVVCDGVNVSCDLGLTKNGAGLALALLLGTLPTIVQRGRPSGFSLALGLVLAILTLFLAVLWEWLEVWIAAAAGLMVIGLAVIGGFIKFRRLRA